MTITAWARFREEQSPVGMVTRAWQKGNSSLVRPQFSGPKSRATSLAAEISTRRAAISRGRNSRCGRPPAGRWCPRCTEKAPGPGPGRRGPPSGSGVAPPGRWPSWPCGPGPGPGAATATRRLIPMLQAARATAPMFSASRGLKRTMATRSRHTRADASTLSRFSCMAQL